MPSYSVVRSLEHKGCDEDHPRRHQSHTPHVLQGLYLDRTESGGDVAHHVGVGQH